MCAQTANRSAQFIHGTAVGCRSATKSLESTGSLIRSGVTSGLLVRDRLVLFISAVTSLIR